MSESDGECELTKEQKEFLEECLVEFAHRFTDEDEDYKKAYERGISTPPIMSPWHGRPRLTANRSSRNSYQGRQHDRERNDSRNFSRNDRNRRFRPY